MLVWYRRLILSAIVLALFVVVLGAYVRLSDAGLGCPDWPGCYGHVGVPEQAHDVVVANQAFPERPVEIAKAWKEMIHRYFASLLGLIICFIAGLAWRLRKTADSQGVGLPIFLVGLVVFQGMLGMWTVTLLLKPLIVMAHLLGGLSTLACLVWLYTASRGPAVKQASSLIRSARYLVMGAFAVLAMQIALGGWTSTNYAALACVDLPTCHNSWVPEMDFKEGFLMWRGLGVNYEFGVLDNEARTAIHWSHRVWAVFTFIVVMLAMHMLLRHIKATRVRVLAIGIGIMLLCQFALGVANVWLSLPIATAVAHNGGAAILVILFVGLIASLQPNRNQGEPA